MRFHVRGVTLQMVYKVVTYVAIVFGGAVSGALVGLVSGPVNIRLSVDNTGMMGACLGAVLAIVGCKFAIERHEAMERNRELFRALECRLSRVVAESRQGPLDA